MVSQTFIHVTDSLMIGRLGHISMAAVGLGGTAFFTYVVFLMNGSVGVQIVTARRLGEKEVVEIGKILTTSIVTSLLGGILFTAFSLWSADPFIDFLSKDITIRQEAKIYLEYRNYGLIFFFLSFVVRGFYDGLGFTYIGMIGSIATFISNVFFNWIWIYGNLGAPALGVKGAAIASSLAGGVGMLAMLLFLYQKDIRYYWKLSGWKLEVSIIKYIFRIGSPAALDGVLTHGAFVYFSKLSGMVGAYSLAASNIIFAVMSLSFMPGFAFGIAATTILGNAMGEKKIQLAKIATYRSAFFAGVLMGMMGILFMIFSRQIIESFNPDPLLYQETYLSLLFVSLVQVGDAYHMVMASALRSAGLVLWVFFAYLGVSYLVMIPFAYIMGIYFGFGTPGLWSSISIWLVLLASIFLWKFQKGDWKTGRV
jgi:putative MATE family efflux protein